MSINSENFIEAENISFKYNRHYVLKNVSFAAKGGEYLGVIGPNGGGKTTLIKIILGILEPASGTIKILGQDIKNFRERFIIGYVPQTASQMELHFPATVEEIVKSGRTAKVGLFKRFSSKDKAAVNKAMEVTEIIKFKNRLIGELSGGERQKVFIARALAGEPKILILDEPVAGVDAPSQERFYQFLNELRQQFGITIIFVSHDINFITKEVKKVLCLNHSMVCYCPPAEFIKEGYFEKLYGGKVKLIKHQH